MKRHRVHDVRTARQYLAAKRKNKHEASAWCTFTGDIRRYKFTRRWDATSCVNCLRAGGIMAPPMVNWGDVEERDFSPIPAATYNCRFSKFDLVTDTPSGFPYYNLEFTVDGGEYADRKLWEIATLAPKGLFATKRTLLAMGADPEDVSPGSTRDPSDVLEELMGNEVRLVVTQRTYHDPDTGEDRIQNDIKRILAPSYVAA